MIALAGLNRPGQTLIADKGYRRARFLRAFRQTIESVNQTLKAHLDLERHGGRTRPGVAALVLRRILALTDAIWHNETTSQPGRARSLTAYDH